jgi:hypothetical protein
MASRELMAPRLPTPPQEITVSYISDLVRALETFVQQETNPGQMRGTKLTLTQLTTSDTGLEPGELYHIGQEIRVSLLDRAVLDGGYMTASVGTVTIVTS